MTIHRPMTIHRHRRHRSVGTLVALAALHWASAATANPWTRDAGHHYANLSYSRIAANSFYGPNKSTQPLGNTYSQDSLGAYLEVGVLSRWLTVSADATLYRRSAIDNQGYTHGLGDMQLGLWSGLLTAPVRLTAGLLVGLPTGDARPEASTGAAAGAELIARSLPTGDGEGDVQWRLALGHGFGGRGSAWPLQHYLRAEVGYWLRTDGFHDAFAYLGELGVKAPYPVIDRLWLTVRLHGVESFASDEQAANSFSGLGDGVTFTGDDAASAIGSDCILGTTDPVLCPAGSVPPIPGCGAEAGMVLGCFPNCPQETIDTAAACVAKCVQYATVEVASPGLPDECVAGTGETVACGAAFCTDVCISNSEAPGCITCRCDNNCIQSFDTCSGLPSDGDCS